MPNWSTTLGGPGCAIITGATMTPTAAWCGATGTTTITTITAGTIATSAGAPLLSCVRRDGWSCGGSSGRKARRDFSSAGAGGAAKHRRDKTVAGLVEARPPWLEHALHQEITRQRKAVGDIAGRWIGLRRTAQEWRQPQQPVAPGPAGLPRYRPARFGRDLGQIH